MDRWNRLRRRVRFLLLHGLLMLLSCLPRSVGLPLFGQMGRLALLLAPSARRQILRNTERIFPNWSGPERERFAQLVAHRLGRNLFDFARLQRYSLAEIEALVRVEGLEKLERARRSGVGVICLSAHLGCWELIPYRMRAYGYLVAVVYRRLRDVSLDAYVAARRRRYGIETHERDTGIRGILRSLRRGALVGILTDQHTRVDSVQAPFLGQEAWTPSGPVRLAWRTGAPIVPLAAAMEEDGTYTLRIGDEVAIPPPPEGGGEESRRALREGCARCNVALEKLILPHKEQWVWFHRRWRDK